MATRHATCTKHIDDLGYGRQCCGKFALYIELALKIEFALEIEFALYIVHIQSRCTSLYTQVDYVSGSKAERFVSIQHGSFALMQITHKFVIEAL